MKTVLQSALKITAILTASLSAIFGVGSASLWKAAANPETINSPFHSVIVLLNNCNFSAADFAMKSAILSSISVLCTLFANEK